MKHISTAAYQALRAALPVVIWNRRPYETFLRTALRDNSELLVGLNFSDTKRNVADQLIDVLVAKEDKYQEVTLQLMLEVASMDRFPNLEQIKDEADRKQRIQEATVAVLHLRSVTEKYSSRLAEAERAETSRKAAVAQAKAIRRFSDDIASLKNRFLGMQNEPNTHKRGYEFESLLADLFLLYDLEPRLSYTTDWEQIDGSFSHDTDDYIMEARWRTDPASRADGSIFKDKVLTKGKNAMGLFVSIAGFTSDFLEKFKVSTPFITLDGTDLYLVLDDRVRLDDLIRVKKRHANDTGSCWFPANEYLLS